MPVPGIYKLSSVVLPGGTIGQIVDQDYAPGIEEMLEGGSANVDADYCAIGEAKPMLSFTTTDLLGGFALCGFNALAIAAETDFYFAAIKEGGIIDTASTHIKMSFSAGMMVPRSLDATQGKDPARLTYDIYPLSSDGLTAPVTITTGQALPSQGLVAQAYSLGPIKINGTTFFSGIQSVRWNFGLNPEILMADGEPFPTFGGVVNRRATCAINGLDVSGLSTFNINGIALTAFASFFRKVAPGGTRVANATAQHVKLSGTKGMLYPRGVRGQHQRPLDGEWNIIPTFDGTNDPVQISTTSAIS